MDNLAYRAWAARWRVPLGFAAAVVYLVFSQPTARSLVIGGAFALAGLFVRGFSAGHLEKNQSLAVSGPYAYTRNPLYLGSAVMGAGFTMASHSWLIALVFVALFLLIYWPVIRREEAFLREAFGESYRRYALETPLFFPRAARALPSPEHFRWRRYRRNREYEAALGYAGVVIFLLLKMMLR